MEASTPAQASHRHGAPAPHMRCPHCEGVLRPRTSKRLSPLLRKITYSCLNPECGFSCTAFLEITTTLSLASVPNPEVSIPLSPHVRCSELMVTLTPGGATS